MIYKVIEGDRGPQTYEGFRPASYLPAKPGEHLAMVFVEGDHECWYLDSNNPIAVDELERFYRGFGFVDVQIQVWRDSAMRQLIEVPDAELGS